MKACLLIRETPCYRRESFEAGLRAVGYDVESRICPSPENVLVIWNRYGHYDFLAKEYERVGGTVVVAENGYLGRDWRGEHWYALSKGFHNGAGQWNIGSADRWDRLGVELKDWRRSSEDNEFVVLETRSIGVPGLAEPRGWSKTVLNTLRSLKITARIRSHPGERPCVPLEDDLRKCRAVVTWGSGAALKALLLGIPVLYGFKKWIGSIAAVEWRSQVTNETNGCNRLEMFRRLSWAMWNTEELASGKAFRWLLK